MQGKTVESWKERVPEIVQGYSKDDMWNMDEMSVFLEGFTKLWLWTEGKGV